MSHRWRNFCIRINRRLAVMLMPVLVLMPLLHAHPVGAVDADHPSGVHLPAANTASASRAAGGASASPAQRLGGDANPPATIVVQDLRQRSARGNAQAAPAAFVAISRGPVTVAAATHRAVVQADVGHPAPLPHEYRPQAPPHRVAAAV